MPSLPKQKSKATTLQLDPLDTSTAVTDTPVSIPFDNTSLEDILNSNCQKDDTSCKYTPVDTITTKEKMVEWIHYNPSATYFNTIATDYKDFCDLKHGSVGLMFNDLPSKEEFFNTYKNEISEGGAEIYKTCAIYCRDSNCTTTGSYINNNKDIIAGHCQSLQFLQPGVEGLVENYSAFTTLVQEKENEEGQTETITLPYGFEDILMCRKRTGLSNAVAL